MTNLMSDAEWAIIRNPDQSTDLFLSVYEPPVVFAGRLSGTYNIGDMFLTVYNTTGTFANIEAGQTIYFGSTEFNDDYGRARVIETSGDQIKIAISKAIRFQPDWFFTVRDFHEIWSVFYRSILDETTRTTTFYKDYDIAYTDQNELFDPVVQMGGNYAGFRPTGTFRSYFISTGSFVLDGSLTTTIWEFPAGSVPEIYTGTTPGWVNLPNVPGHYTVKCTVNTAWGKSRTGYRHYSLYDRPGEGANTPILDWSLEELSGSFEEGWVARIAIGEGADRIKDGYLIKIFADDYFGGQRRSFGGYAGQEHIVFVGYVDMAETQRQWGTNKTIFTIKGLTHYLKNKELYSVSLETSQDASDWTQLNNMTLNKIIFHYLRWHTTVLDVADWTPFLTEHADYRDQFEDIPRGEILSGVSQVANRVFGRFTSDRRGRFYSETDLNMLPTGTRPASIGEILETDWIGTEILQEKIDKPLSEILLGGVSFDPTNLTGSAFLSRAPGLHPGIGYTGKGEVQDGLMLPTSDGQDAINELSGLYFAKTNNRFTVNNQLVNNVPIDVVPQAFYDFTMPSGTVFRGLNISSRIIPRRIILEYKGNKLTENIEWEFESSGPPGETYIIPTEPPDIGWVPTPGDVPTPSPDPAPGIDFGGRQTWVVTDEYIGYTNNLLASSPSYINKTGAVAGSEIVDFVLDPYDPTNTVFALTDTAIWKSVNAANNAPAWKKVFSLVGTNSNQFSSTLDPQFTRIKTTIARKGRLYAMAYAKVSASSSTYNLYIYRTSDGGETWTKCATSSTLVNGPWFTLGQLGAQVVSSSSATDPDNIVTAASDCSNYAQINGGGYIVVDLGQQYTFNQVRAKGTWDGINSYITLDGSNDNSSFTSILDAGAAYRLNSESCTVNDTSPSLGSNTYRYLKIGQNPFALGNWQRYFEFSVSITAGSPPVANLSGALDCGQHNPDYVYYSDGLNIYRSTNAGASFSVYIAQGAYDVECPYAGNPTDNDITYWRTNGELHKTNGASAGSALLTESYPNSGHRRTCTFVQGTGATIYVIEATASNSKTVKKTYNTGGSWTTGQSGISGATQIGLWPYRQERVFLLSSSQILYSTDGGINFSNKTGNWSSVMGESFANGKMIVPNWSVTE